jgi:hypothetical protein
MLKIKIIGTEDSKQKALVNRVKQAIEELAVDASIDQITNWEDIIAHNIIQTPALAIRHQVLSQGFVPQVTELKTLIAAFLPDLKKNAQLIDVLAQLEPDNPFGSEPFSQHNLK